MPSGFRAAYGTRWELWEPLLDGMAAHYADPVVRFNLAGAARGGLVLHADVAPGMVHPQAAANLLRVVEMFRARGVGYRRSFAGGFAARTCQAERGRVL